jgi:hypothetical protein
MNWLILQALDAVLPGHSDCPGLAASQRGPAVVAELRREAPIELRLVLNLATVMWLFMPIFTVYLPLPAIWLPSRFKHRHTERITTTSVYLVRQIALVLKQVAGLAWGQDPEVRKAYGLAPYAADPGSWKGM